MKNLNTILFGTFLAVGSFITFNSCEKKGGCDETNISEAGDDESHNMGQNCMQCHTSGGKGEGCFTVAGTAYNEALTSTLNTGTIELYSGPNGTGNLVTTVKIDSKGNFYTTASVSINGLYPAITGPTGQKQYMGSALSSGQCNSCHGVSTGKIWGN